MINTSSKVSLKMSCLAACDNDVDRAQKLYKFMAEGVESLPDFDVPKPNFIQQAQQTLDGVFGVLDQNEERIVKAYNYYQMFRGGANVPSAPVEAVDIPPLPQP